MSVTFNVFPSQGYIGTPYWVPCKLAKGARMVPLQFNWQTYCQLLGAATDTFVANAAVNVNLQTNPTGGSKLLDAIRSVFIDNTGNPAPIFVQAPDTGWTVQCKPYGSGWFPMLTNGFLLVVAGTGFAEQTAGATNVWASNANAPPYSDAAVDVVLEQRLASPVIGGGASLADISIDNQGSWYNAATINIAGGGGEGATAGGTLDIYGRFLTALLSAEGGGYSGQPLVTATGAQTPPAAFNSAASYSYPIPGNFVAYNGVTWYWNGPVYTSLGYQNQIQCGAANWQAQNYASGTQVNYLDSIYISTRAVTGTGVNVPPSQSPAWAFLGSQFPSTAGNWIDTGVSSTPVTAEFSAVLSPVSAPIVTPGFGSPALGDQVDTRINTANAGVTGVISQNMFGTPYASGFIYITGISEYIDEPAAANVAMGWELVSSVGTASGFEYEFFFNEFSETGNSNYPFEIFNQSGMNIKLDATKTWEINLTSNTGGAVMRRHYIYTYSQQ